MLDAIYAALTGMQGTTRALNEVANNTANLNTAGFKAGRVPLGDLFHASAQEPDLARAGQGNGVKTYDVVRDTRQGPLRTTGGALDVAVDGGGLFILQTADDARRYTRDGQFRLNADNVLVTANGARVLDRNLRSISVDNRTPLAGRATSSLLFRGNLSSTADRHDINGVSVFDAAGAQHTLKLTATRDPNADKPVWTFALTEGDATLGSTVVNFTDGLPDAASQKPVVSLTFAGQSGAQSITLDLSSDVTSFAGGNTSTLAVTSQDGFGSGTLSGLAFDASGHLVLSYTNGQSRLGAQLGLARFALGADPQPQGDNTLAAPEGASPLLGAPGDEGFGTLTPGAIEGSNVDLTRELSDVIVLQRGFQSSSQVLSTASEMLEKLFELGGKRK